MLWFPANEAGSELKVRYRRVVSDVYEHALAAANGSKHLTQFLLKSYSHLTLI